MKKLILVFMLFCSIKSNGQAHKIGDTTTFKSEYAGYIPLDTASRLSFWSSYNYQSPYFFTLGNSRQIDACLPNNSDTLEIYTDKVKYIRIDGKLYKIEKSLTLIK